MLPPLRGGELILLPRKVLSESGVSLPLLLRELASSHCCAVVIDAVPAGTPPIPLLVTSTIGAYLEGEINRLLTEQRGELYRAGTELERLMVDLSSAQAELSVVTAAIAGMIGIPMAIVDSHGHAITSTAPGAAPAVQLIEPRVWDEDHLGIRLSDGHSLWLGPVPAGKRALVRMMSDRIAGAIEAALVRAAQSRPRGPARAVAIQELLTSDNGDLVSRAASLGIPTDGHFRVVLAVGEQAETALPRALAQYGTAHEGGMLDGFTIGLIELRSENTLPTPRRATAHENGSSHRKMLSTLPPGLDYVAISSVAAGVQRLPEAYRQASYSLSLMRAKRVPGPVVRFDTVDDLGAYRLLYHLWGSPVLQQYADEALGSLVSRDRRGTLRNTLMAYLDAGGSHVDTAERLGIHRNTLAYRLKQIATLTGYDPTDPAPRLMLHLALLSTMLPPPPNAK
jgi:sugar diacid utilization regulator